MKTLKIGCLVAALAAMAMAGCQTTPAEAAKPAGGSAAAWAAIAGGAPVRVAVFVDNGARGVGMYRWMQLMSSSPDLVATYVDGESIRKGALRDVDLLVMPGGSSSLEIKRMQPEGVEELKRFIREGGAYVGTCAGCYVLINRQVRIAPYMDRKNSSGSGLPCTTIWSKRAEELTGVKAGEHLSRFHGGPRLVPTGEPIEGANIEIIARHGSDFGNGGHLADRAISCGTGSALAGTYGRGRVFGFTDHPEYFPYSWPLVRGAFKFLTGRDIRFDEPKPVPGRRRVGIHVSASPGPASAAVLMALQHDPALDVTPVTDDQIAEGALHHFDIFVANDAPDATRLADAFSKSLSRAKYRRFMNAGGHVVTWGRTAQFFAKEVHANLHIAANGEEAKALVKSIPLSPAPAVSASRATAALYCGAGVSAYGWFHFLRALDASAGCDLAFVDAAGVAAGALKGANLFVLPGAGGEAAELAGLGRPAATALNDWVRDGGVCYASGAGCDFALADTDPETRPRAALVPLRAVKTNDRMTAPVRVKYLRNQVVKSLPYTGGPLMESTDAAGAKAIAATYVSDFAYLRGGDGKWPKIPFRGKAAIASARLGKGRALVSGPVAEVERTPFLALLDDLSRKLGGVSFALARESDFRQPNALSVAFYVRNPGTDGARLAQQLLRERGIDVYPVDADRCGRGDLWHADVLVLPHPTADDFSPYVKRYLADGGKVWTFGVASGVQLPQGVRTFGTADELLRACSEKISK